MFDMSATSSPRRLRLSEAAMLEGWEPLLQRYGRIGYWCSVPEVGVCWWSSEIYDLLGVARDLESVPSIEDFCGDSEDRARLEDAVGRAVTGGESWTLELRMRRPDGSTGWVRSTGRAESIRGRTWLHGTLQDIGDVQEHRRRADTEEAFLRTILDNLPYMIFVKDAKDLRFVRFNRAGLDLLGKRSEDLIGRNDHDLFPEEQAEFFVKKDRETLGIRGVVDIPEETINTPSGRRTLHTRKITVTDAGGSPAYLLGISEDITEAKARELTNTRQQAALIQASRLSALAEMAGGLAHDINSPLAIIRALAEQLQLVIAPGNPAETRLNEMAERVVLTVDRIAQVVKGLRDFSRDSTRDPVEAQSIELLVRETVRYCESRFRLKGISIEVNVPAHLRARIQKINVQRALINLLTNASEALSSAKACPALIVIDACEREGKVAIRVSDNGPGVDEAVKDGLMTPFVTTKGAGSGRGLGLSISRNICEAQGGALTYLTSARGAVFEMTLPRAE